MSIIYLISILLINVLFLLTKRSNEKLNLIYEITKLTVINLCYNVFIVYILSIFNLLSKLSYLSILNIIFAAIMLFYIYKKKEIQKYFIKLKDIIAFIIILTIVIAIVYKNYGIPFNVQYLTTDPATHYIASSEFYENSILLQKVDNNTLYSLKDMMPGAYVNIGILFKLASSCISPSYFYIFFILFDIYILFISALLFYFTINKYAKGKILNLLSYIACIFYITAYPLNNMIFGFFYLGIGVLIINLILNLFNEYIENKINKKFIIMLIFLTNFGLFFTYYLFMPVVYFAEFIFLLYYFLKQKKVISKESILTLIVTLIIPTILGVVYFILPAYLDPSIMKQTSMIKMEGFIYRDLYSNFIFFIPFTLYYIIDLFKNKKITIELITTLFLIAFMIVLFVAGIYGKVSSYYYFKNYYLLWLLIYITMFIGIVDLYKKSKDLVIIFVIVYSTIFGINYLGIDNIITNKNELFNIEGKSRSLNDIYWFNKIQIDNKNIIITKEQMDLIHFVYDKNKDDKLDVYFVGDILESLWSYSILKQTNKTNLVEFYNKEPMNIIEWEQNNKKTYLICLYDNEYYKKNIETFKKYDIMYENNSGFVIYK